jgi:Chemotaxis response regulator containing a CheY-like receiver domain and a methylesterase domain
MSSDAEIADVSLGERERDIQAIVIGASAGGISALLTLLAPLPQTLRLPIITVLHVAEEKSSKLTEVFSYHVAAPVCFAQDKAYVAADTVYFASPGYHLSIEKGRWFSLSREEPRFFSRPSIDFLLTSAADAYGAALLAIVLTGANEDGAEGLAAVARAGGITVVQDPDEAEFDIMPKAALNTCRPDRILPLMQIRTLIYRLETLDAG